MGGGVPKQSMVYSRLDATRADRPLPPSNSFSREGERLGDKKSLEQHVQEVTEVAVGALAVSALPDFSIAERMSWAEKRDTTRGEDQAYCLLGIFDVYMPLIYGEGKENALRRLRKKIDSGLPHLQISTQRGKSVFKSPRVRDKRSYCRVEGKD